MERSALVELWTKCGGPSWKYRHIHSRDKVSKGQPWKPNGGGDPCEDGWYGVRCQADDDDEYNHVVEIFPNQRFSGNPLKCQLPESIGDFSRLVHLYTSNDATPSSLHGSIPRSIGKLKRLRCLYFSHNKLSGPLPRELEQLTLLENFLMRYNNFSGPLVNFSKLPHLTDVWFDHNRHLTGTLDALGKLKNLTKLQASHINGITGYLPKSLCFIDCDASWDRKLSCAKDLPKGCCHKTFCGSGPRPPKPKPTNRGICHSQ